MPSASHARSTQVDPLSELLANAQSGDTIAKDSLFGALLPIVRTVSRRVCARIGRVRDEHLVEDVISDVYYQILRPEIRRYQPERASVGRYVLGLALNSIKSLQPRRMRLSIDLERADDGGVCEPIALNSDAAEECEKIEAMNQQLQIVSELLNDAERSTSIAVSRHIANGEPLISIAVDLGLHATTVARRIERFLVSGRLKAAALAA